MPRQSHSAGTLESFVCNIADNWAALRFVWCVAKNLHCRSPVLTRLDCRTRDGKGGWVFEGWEDPPPSILHASPGRITPPSRCGVQSSTDAPPSLIALIRVPFSVRGALAFSTTPPSRHEKIIH